MTPSPVISMANNNGNSDSDFIFLSSKITADIDCSHEIKRHLLLGRKAMKNLNSILKSRDITFRGLNSQGYDFSSSHVWMWESIRKTEQRRIDVFELWCWRRLLKSPLDCKESQPVHAKDQSWAFFGRTDVEAETPIIWPPDVKSWLIGKDPDAGKDWRQEEKGTTEDETFG